MTDDRCVTVFGGTGFFGGAVVRRLHQHGFSVRIASRRPERALTLFPDESARLQPVAADVHDDASVAAALAGACAAVNAVSLYVEQGSETFQAVHVEAAARVARHARERGQDE